MSVIGVEKTENKIRFAYDSQTTRDDRALFGHEPKVFQVGHIIVGVVGESVIKQELKRYLEILINSEDTNVANFVLDEPITVLRFFDEFLDQDLYVAPNALKQIKENEDPGSLFISDGRKVFYFAFKDWTCSEVKDYDFIGSGWKTAEGAYLAYKRAGHLFDALKESIDIACKVDLYCGGPSQVLEIPYLTK